jgi:hypothetical protein
LDEIDKKLVSCRLQMEEYAQATAHLHTLNGRLSRFGVEPLAIPNLFPTHDLGEILKERIDRLRSQGRL